MKIITPNLDLIQSTEEILNAAIESDDKLSQILGCKVKKNWSEFGVEAFPYVLDKITSQPEAKGWWTYFPIHRKDNQLIGSGGFKGLPDAQGMVEIGYEISHHYRNQGFATEMAKGLISHALNDTYVKVIHAHTLAQENPSTRVLGKCGFEIVEEINDPEDGLIWKWVLHAPKISKA